MPVHVAEALDAVGFAEAVADFVVDGPGFFVALAGERVLVTVVEPICAAKQDVALCLRFQRFPCQVMAFSQGQKLGYPRVFPPELRIVAGFPPGVSGRFLICPEVVVQRLQVILAALLCLPTPGKEGGRAVVELVELPGMLAAQPVDLRLTYQVVASPIMPATLNERTTNELTERGIIQARRFFGKTSIKDLLVESPQQRSIACSRFQRLGQAVHDATVQPLCRYSRLQALPDFLLRHGQPRLLSLPPQFDRHVRQERMPSGQRINGVAQRRIRQSTVTQERIAVVGTEGLHLLREGHQVMCQVELFATAYNHTQTGAPLMRANQQPSPQPADRVRVPRLLQHLVSVQK